MSNRAAPEIVTGFRSPTDRGPAVVQSVAESELNRKLAAVRSLTSGAVAKPGEVVYQSRAYAYRYQLTSIADRLDPATGQLIRARPRVAQFHQGIYRTSDPDDIKRLDASTDCGVGRDFWRADDMKQAALEKQVESLSAAVKASGDPALIERVVADLMPLIGQTEFSLPPAPSADEQESVATE